MDLCEAMCAYQDKFDDSLPVYLLPPDLHEVAAEMISQAVTDGRPFESDDAFLNALGVNPLPDDTLS
jgi:hypothetical protein